MLGAGGIGEGLVFLMGGGGIRGTAGLEIAALEARFIGKGIDQIKLVRGGWRLRRSGREGLVRHDSLRNKLPDWQFKT
jgi:hypothetical protein